MIHPDNPFADDPEQRDPTRQFRGRLTAPVTIVTSGGGTRKVGLTVSSLLVVEGDPGRVEMVVGPTTDVWEIVAESGRFVVHVCRAEHRPLADVFAGLRPSPGGVFAALATHDSDWGPIIDAIGDRAFCAFESRREIGYTGLITGTIDRVETTTLTDPLVYFRGGYRAME